MPAVRISISTDHLLLRDGLHLVLGAEASFVLLNDDGSTGASRTCDIAIIDGQMEGALVRCARIKAKDGPSVIFVGVEDDYEWCMEALRAGARGLVSTHTTSDTLVRVVHAVHQGGMWVPEHLLVASMRRAATTSQPGLDMLERLSAREAEVFRHAATGLCNKDLADHLHIAEATVKVHLTNIFAKLGLRGRAELAAAYHGILHQPVAAAAPKALPPEPPAHVRARVDDCWPPKQVVAQAFRPADRAKERARVPRARRGPATQGTASIPSNR